jgi:quercetin dioxygenase-like cupin family protein
MRRLIIPGLVVGAFSLGVLIGQASGQAKPRMWADRLLDVVTEDLPRKARVVANLDHWDPGAESGRHTHPGPTVILVLEGELEEVQADGRTRLLRPGQGIWDGAKTTHNVRNRTGQPARALAIHLDPAS